MDGTAQPGFDLDLRLVGRMRLIRSDGVEVTPTGRKAQGLLVLIGVAPELRRHRSWLQDKLWSDRPPERGAASLRQELASIRRALGEAKNCLITDAGWVALDRTRVKVKLDPEREDWELTGGAPEFAAGLDIADPEFEDWIRDQRTVFADRLEVRQVPAGPPAAAEPATELPMSLEPSAPSPSIAVMPLTPLGDVEEGRLIATGLAIDVIGRLTRFRRLDAIAHASSAALAGLKLTPREIGRRLGSRYVTEGVIWLGRPRLRISVDLIDASTEHVIWSEQFDRPFDDVFDIVDELAALLTAGLMVEVDKRERARVRAREPNSLDAYELCLRGLDEMLRLDRAGCDSALALFSRAAEREHGYARALSGISRAHGFYWKYRWTEDREAALARADEYAVQAVDSDVNDAAANAALGWVGLYSRNHDRALAAYTRAMELNPSDADILAEYADALSHSGSNAQAIPLFERAIRLNPQMSDIYRKDLAYAHLKAEQYEAAIRTIQSMRRPQIADIILTASLAMAGYEEAARRAAEGVRRARPGFSPDAWITMVPDLNYDDTARYLEGLKRAGL